MAASMGAGVVGWSPALVAGFGLGRSRPDLASTGPLHNRPLVLPAASRSLSEAALALSCGCRLEFRRFGR